MLVLSRKTEEAIQIGDEITVKVLSVKGGVVRLGFEVPKDVSIFRSELLPGFEACPPASMQVASPGSAVATAS